MTEPQDGGTAPLWRVQQIERQIADELVPRLRRLEAYEIAVLLNRLESVEKRLGWQTTALFSAAVSLLLAALAVTVTIATRGG